MDFVLGGFADAQLATLSDSELKEVEAWLEIADQRLFAFVNGAQTPPAALDTALFRRLCDFHGNAATLK